MSESQDSNSSNTRWWESYLVRYLSGSIVGAFCIIAIMLSLAQDNLINFGKIKDFLPSEGKDFPIVGILVCLLISGLVYSYVISSPITVYHYGRGGSQKIEALSRYMWLGWAWTIFISFFPYINHLTSWLVYSSIIILLTFLYKLLIGKEDLKKINKKNDNSSLFLTIIYCLISSLIIIIIIELYSKYFSNKINAFNQTLLLFSIPALFVGIMQYITLFRILHSEGEIHDFYKELIKARALNGAKDVRETYSHLREHSNSTFIVVLEICFTCLIIFFIQNSRNSIDNLIYLDYKNLLTHGLGFLMFWSIPNVFMWSRANKLENNFLKNPTSYISKDN